MELRNLNLPDETPFYVSEKHRVVEQILRDYDRDLRLHYMPAEKRGPQGFAFRVTHTKDGQTYPVAFAHECDERLLAVVFNADAAKRGDILKIMEAQNTALELINHKKQLEELQAAAEFAHGVLSSPKIHYKHDGIDYGKPFGGRFG